MTTMQDSPNVPPTYIDPQSWDEAVAWLFRFSGSGRIYRGQRDYSWTLRTRLARDLDKLPPDTIGLSIENSAIGYFMDQATGLLPAVPDEHDLLGWLALMQHYGAPTRLLDWSQSPFVATYFAYEQSAENDSALYALDPYFCRRQFVGSLFPMPWDHTGTMGHSATDSDGNTITTYPTRTQYRRDRENELLRWSMTHSSRWPLPTIPFDQDARMSAQQTIFTLAGEVTAVIDDLFDRDKWPPPVDRMPGGFIAGSDSTIWPLDHPGQLLTKIRMRSEWRNEALEALAKMGLTAASLFPGLDGLGRATSLHVETGRLALRDVLTGLSPT
jgi:FRG domain